MKKALQVLSFATLAILLGGCASYSHHNQYAAQATTDQVISSDVEQAFAQDKRLRHYNISVNTVHGAVTLAGYVPSKHLRKHAVYLARTTPGVVAVDASMLQVGRVHHKAAMSQAPSKKATHHAAKKHHHSASNSSQSSGSQSSSSTPGSTSSTTGNSNSQGQ